MGQKEDLLKIVGLYGEVCGDQQHEKLMQEAQKTQNLMNLHELDPNILEPLFESIKSNTCVGPVESRFKRWTESINSLVGYMGELRSRSSSIPSTDYMKGLMEKLAGLSKEEAGVQQITGLALTVLRADMMPSMNGHPNSVQYASGPKAEISVLELAEMYREYWEKPELENVIKAAEENARTCQEVALPKDYCKDVISQFIEFSSSETIGAVASDTSNFLHDLNRFGARNQLPNSDWLKTEAKTLYDLNQEKNLSSKFFADTLFDIIGLEFGKSKAKGEFEYASKPISGVNVLELVKKYRSWCHENTKNHSIVLSDAIQYAINTAEVIKNSKLKGDYAFGVINSMIYTTLGNGINNDVIRDSYNSLIENLGGLAQPGWNPPSLDWIESEIEALYKLNKEEKIPIDILTSRLFDIIKAEFGSNPAEKDEEIKYAEPDEDRLKVTTMATIFQNRFDNEFDAIVQKAVDITNVWNKTLFNAGYIYGVVDAISKPIDASLDVTGGFLSYLSVALANFAEEKKIAPHPGDIGRVIGTILKLHDEPIRYDVLTQNIMSMLETEYQEKSEVDEEIKYVDAPKNDTPLMEIINAYSRMQWDSVDQLIANATEVLIRTDRLQVAPGYAAAIACNFVDSTNTEESFARIHNGVSSILEHIEQLNQRDDKIPSSEVVNDLVDQVAKFTQDPGEMSKTVNILLNDLMVEKTDESSEITSMIAKFGDNVEKYVELYNKMGNPIARQRGYQTNPELIAVAHNISKQVYGSPLTDDYALSLLDTLQENSKWEKIQGFNNTAKCLITAIKDQYRKSGAIPMLKELESDIVKFHQGSEDSEGPGIDDLVCNVLVKKIKEDSYKTVSMREEDKVGLLGSAYRFAFHAGAPYVLKAAAVSQGVLPAFTDSVTTEHLIAYGAGMTVGISDKYFIPNMAFLYSIHGDVMPMMQNEPGDLKQMGIKLGVYIGSCIIGHVASTVRNKVRIE